MSNTAAELKATLSQFNKGIKEVTVEFGIVCVYVRSMKAAAGVQLDLLRSGGFKKVSITKDGTSAGLIVHGVV